MRKLEGYLSRPLPNLFSTLLTINKSIYCTLNKVYIHIHYLLCNTYYTSFELILFENYYNVTKRFVLELQFLDWYWFSFPIIFLRSGNTSKFL